MQSTVTHRVETSRKKARNKQANKQKRKEMIDLGQIERM